MAERKLNLNAPLLSVRRSSGRTASSIGERKENSQRGSKLLALASSKADSCLDLVTEPVAVPFHWEQIPGRRKHSSFPDSIGRGPKVEANSFDWLKERMNDKASADSENEDDVFDTLQSATDSFSVHCSVSGLSDFDNLATVKPFATDPQIRDFMMSRFLPAAKAMTLEIPHYASRNKPVPGEQPRQRAVVVPSESLPTVQLEVQEKARYEHSEDRGVEYCDTANITTTRGCGLLPRLCVRNSSSCLLLNPVTGIKVKTLNSISPSRDAHSAKQIRKAAFARSQSPTIKRPTMGALKPKMEDDVRSPRLAGVENKLAFGSDRFNIANRTLHETPRSPFGGKGFLGVPKGHGSFKTNTWNANRKSQELVPYDTIRRGSHPTVEKTLKVDSVNVVGKLSSHSSNAKGSIGSAEKETKTLIQSATVVKTSTGMSPDRGQSNFVEDLSQDSKVLVWIRTRASNTDVNTSSDQISKGDCTENLKVCHLPPLVPKTPSESWLWRTLPSISSHSSLNRHDSNINTKWENIVKSSYLHHDHVRYSEELFPHASQKSNG